MKYRLFGVFLLALLPFLLIGAFDSLPVEITVAPNVLNLDSGGTWITIHADIPYADVKSASVTLNGIPVEFTKADDCGNLVAKFLIDDVAAVLTPGRNQLTLAGVTEEGDTFTGTGEITVIRRHGRR